MRVGTEAYLAQLTYLEILMVGVGLRRGPAAFRTLKRVRQVLKERGSESEPIRSCRRHDPATRSLRCHPEHGAGRAALLLRGGTVIDGTGAPRFAPTFASRASASSRSAPNLAADGAVVDRRRRPDRRAGLHRRAHPRRPDRALGTAHAAQDQPGRHHRRRRQLRHQPGAAGARQRAAAANLLGGADKYVYPTMAAYVAAVDAARPAVNVAALVGHSTLRVATMDDPYRAATPAEQARMCALLREGIAAGAAGLSSGVFYATGAAADIDELALLAGIAGEAGGVYTTHIRQEMDKVIDSLDEAFATAQPRPGAARDLASQVRGPAQLGPHGRRRWPTSMPRARGQEIGLDCYPYIAGSTVLRSDMVDGIIDILDHLVDAAPGDGGAHAGRHRRRMGLHAAGSVRAAAARRRLLFPDARGRRAARAAATRRR